MRSDPIYFLAGCKIAVSGDFGAHVTLLKIKQWIRAAGGRYKDKIDEHVTHLVCSHAHYKQRAGAVVEAEKHRRLKVVSLDWLEEVLTHRKRCSVRPEHLVANQVKQRLVAKEQRRMDRKHEVKARTTEFIDQLATVSRSLGVTGYKPHVDPVEGFMWEAHLYRVDAVNGSNHRVHLRLVETLDAPKYFGVYVDLRSSNRHTTDIICNPPANFDRARAAFEHQFKELAGFPWAERDVGYGAPEGKWEYVRPKWLKAVRGAAVADRS